MNDKERGKKSGGGKLSRSEAVTVRFDAELRYMLELAARKHRRTLSSYIEWAVEESLSETQMTEDYSDEVCHCRYKETFFG